MAKIKATGDLAQYDTNGNGYLDLFEQWGMNNQKAQEARQETKANGGNLIDQLKAGSAARTESKSTINEAKNNSTTSTGTGTASSGTTSSGSSSSGSSSKGTTSNVLPPNNSSGSQIEVKQPSIEPATSQPTGAPTSTPTSVSPDGTASNSASSSASSTTNTPTSVTTNTNSEDSASTTAATPSTSTMTSDDFNSLLANNPAIASLWSEYQSRYRGTGSLDGFLKEYGNRKEVQQFVADNNIQTDSNGTTTYTNNGSSETFSNTYGKWLDSAGQATSGYYKNVENINKELKDKLGDLSSNYDTDLDTFKTNIEKARTAYNNAMNTATSNYQKAVNQYSGENGYNNSLRLAQEGAAQSAANAGAQVQGAARSTGMSRAAAAAMGAGSVVNAYNNGLAAQQSQSANMYNQALNGQGNIYNQNVNQAATGLNSATAQNESWLAGRGNAYNMGVNNANQYATNMTNALGQDVTNKSNMAGTIRSGETGVETILDRTNSGAGQGIQAPQYTYTPPAKETSTDTTDDQNVESHASGNLVGWNASGATMGPDNTVINARKGELVLNANQQKNMLNHIENLEEALAKANSIIEQRTRKYSDLIIR